jgi:hypothetical protein
MKQELDNAQKVERYTLKQKYAAQLIEKEKELEAITMEMRYSVDFRTYKEKAVKRASLTVDISTINMKLRNLQQSKPILGYSDGMANNFNLKNIGG